KWASAVPGEESSLVDIEYSAFGPDGPWWLVAQDIPNNGKHQWTIPNYPSEQVCLRLIVKSEPFGTDTATSNAFNILGEPNSVLNKKLPKQTLLFPNPGSDRIYLNDAANIKSIRFFDDKGIELNPIHNPSGVVNVSQLPRGVYFLRFIFNDGTIRNEKLMKLSK
ncbi:MAG: T9SS type A sorting domain-containing protein, partial [Bacteroidales bacterium]|nr:T9SS type A sorting domain-containing protein [Bacteroidales bacterium]